jgi:hypothetical protein
MHRYCRPRLSVGGVKGIKRIDLSGDIAIKLTALSLVMLIFGLPILAFLWMTSVPGRSYAGPLPPLTTGQQALADRLRADVVAVASKPHNVRYPQALERSADYIERTLEGAGYAVVRHPYRVGNHVVRNIEAVWSRAPPMPAPW